MNTRKDLGSELAALQQRLGTAQGKRYWRSLEELANTPVFQELMQREFPEQASGWPDALSRRQFLGLMGASLGLAGLTGCSVRPAPSTEIVPYVHPPEEIIPGRPLFFASAMTLGGGFGVLVESHEGRPTKIEGNPEHPASLGATNVYGQASVLQLYDPDRSQVVRHLGQTRTWDQASAVLRAAMRQQGQVRGKGLRLLTESIYSPTLAWQLEQFLKKFPEAKWHQYEPVNRDNAYRAAAQAFGSPMAVRYDFRKADVVLSLDADFFMDDAGSLRYVADFMARRRVRTSADDAANARMNRLYVAETEVTCTGAKADHRLALPAQQIETLARALAAELQVPGAPPAGAINEAARRWVRAVADDLRTLDPEPGQKRDRPRPPGTTLVIASHRQPPAVHLLAHALNAHLGNISRTVHCTEPIEARAIDQAQSLRELVQDMEKKQVELLLILSGNPVYTAPTDSGFREQLHQVPLRIHHGLYEDESSRQCHWHLPETHYLEAWSDTRAFDGTVSIVQPLIQPLYHGRSAHELLSLLADHDQQLTSGYEIVRAYWRRHWHAGKHSGKFEDFWQTSVHDGIVADTAFPAKAVSLRQDWHEQLPAPPGEMQAGTGLELVFQVDPTIYDGRFANIGWLQELPKPITKLTWDNAVLMSPSTAKHFGFDWGKYAHGGEHGGYYMPVVELELQGRRVRGAVWIMPGHADDSITVNLGYGRQYAGRVGGSGEHQLGFNAYALRTLDRPWFAAGLSITKTGDSYPLACTQQHHLMENREPVRAGTLDEYHQQPAFALEREKEAEREATLRARKPLTLYQPFDYGPPRHRWGMAIDLTTCIGCNACVAACQAENNIPVVGKEQVLAGREMHWIRIDRYISGPFEKPAEIHFQPVPCMHCENAPCEYVCPVEATVHSAEGLNDMVYNRCVGTRFCSNNCPYKVRRFNFFLYADYARDSLRLQYNPDVTVRSRGVMEKCTYCVQRIRHAEIGSQTEGRTIRDGDVLTACQAACPASAISFGDINDPHSAVKHWKDTPLNYGLLADLNTLPRTTYLAALRNPNPELEAD